MNNQQFLSAPLQPPNGSLPRAGQLLKEALKIYKSRFWVFVGIMIIPVLLSLLFLGLTVILKLLKAPWLWFILGIVGILALIIINLWAGVSLLYAIKEREQRLGVKESLAKGWHKILSYWWISIIAGFITMGGFLLFIIPGIIFAVWFSLAIYVLVSEDIKGMNALFKSKQLVRGYWGKVFWRFLVMGIVFVVIVVPIAVLAEIFDIPFVTQIISVLIAPFTVTFGFLIYESLQGLKREIAFEPPKRKTKIGFILIGIIGILLIPAILASFVWISTRGARKTAKDVGVRAEMSMMRVAAEIYAMENNDSYEGFSCSYPRTTNSCNYITEQLGEKPIIHSSKDAYCSYVKLLSSEYFCVDSTGSGRRTNIYPGGVGYCDGLTFVCP